MIYANKFHTKSRYPLTIEKYHNFQLSTFLRSLGVKWEISVTFRKTFSMEKMNTFCVPYHNDINFLTSDKFVPSRYFYLSSMRSNGGRLGALWVIIFQFHSMERMISLPINFIFPIFFFLPPPSSEFSRSTVWILYHFHFHISTPQKVISTVSEHTKLNPMKSSKTASKSQSQTFPLGEFSSALR